jgi:hypothetical protein
MTEPTTTNRAQAVAAWTLHYEADPAAARARLNDMRANGVPAGHVAEKLGAFLALTPHADRCEHYGDRNHCTQCQTAQWDAEAEAKRAERAERRRARVR